MTKHMHSVTVWYLSPSGSKMWPEQKFETENENEIPSLRTQAETKYAKQIKNGTVSIEIEEYDTTHSVMKIGFE